MTGHPPVPRLAAVALLVLGGVAAAVLPPVRLVKDVNEANLGSNPQGIGFANGLFYFSTAGQRWQTDGTPGGTVPVQSAPVVRPAGFFRGCDTDHGCELWYSDGTAGAEHLVVDIQPGMSSSSPDSFATIGEYTYFRAFFPTFGAVWRTDGTVAGTTLVSAESGSSGDFVRSLGGQLYFTGDELFITDGTPAGTHVAVDVNGTIQPSDPRNLIAFGDALYFTADDAANLRQVFRSDGTPAGTHPITAFTVATQRSSFYGPMGELTVFGDRLYFRACHVDTGCELWASDGTLQGTTLFADLNQGPANGFELDFRPTPLANLLLFPARHADFGRELWRTDGTAAGTFVLVNANGTAADSFPSAVIGSEGENGTQAFFSAEGFGIGAEPWRTDGTTEGTYLLGDLEKSGFGSDIQSATLLGDRACFRARTTDNTPDVVCSDGTTEGTVTAVDVPPRVGLYPDWLSNAGGSLWLSTGDLSSGREPWRSDGTLAGSAPVADLSPGAPGSEPREFVAVGDTVYFSAQRPDVGIELWRSDGTADGTSLVVDLCPGPSGASPIALTEWDGALLFFANGGTGEDPLPALWRSDGTAEGTVPIGPYGYGPPGYFHLYRASTQVFYGRCGFFSFPDGPGGCELWRTDGTADGTLRLFDVPEEVGHFRSIESIAVTGDRAVFGVLDIVRTGPNPGDATYEASLWSSDGTREGTAPFLSSLTGFYYSFGVVPGPNGVYFTRSDSYPTTLYRTDGTAPGTVPLFESSDQIGLMLPLPGSDALFFRSCHTSGLCGVWVTDGTRDGTGRVLDASYNTPLAVLGDTLLLSGQFENLGEELLAVDISSPDHLPTTTTTVTTTTIVRPTLPSTTSTTIPLTSRCTVEEHVACQDEDACTADRCVLPSHACEHTYVDTDGTIFGVQCTIQNVSNRAAGLPSPICVGRCSCHLRSKAAALEQAVDAIAAAQRGRACRRRIEALRRRLRKTTTVVQRLRERGCVSDGVAHDFLVDFGRARDAVARFVAAGGCDS